jgi:hypothetical protein
MQKSDFALDFSVPLAPQDWTNLAASRVSKVMLPLPFCDTATLDRLHSMGVRLVIRVPEGSYGDDLAPGRIRNQVLACQAHVSVVVVIVGCEPEAAFDFRYGAASWRQDVAYSHRDALSRVAAALRAAGFTVVSPGWRMRSISEDEPAQPGIQTWTEICRLSYDTCNGNGGHLYEYGWDGPVDELRFKFALKDLQTRFHQPIYLDEVGISGGATSAQKMRSYIEMAQLLVTEQIGQRVLLFCPFVSNGSPGNPPAWSPGYLLSDPQCYVELGQWMVA